MARSQPVENLLPLNVWSIINNLQKWYRSSPMDCSQLQSTTASYGKWRERRLIEMTGRYRPPFTGQYPLSSTCMIQASACYKSQDLLQTVGREHATFGMPGQRTSYEGTQDVKIPATI